MGSPPATQRSTARRLAKRGAYDTATIHAILDEGFICHVAFVADGSPTVIPTGHGRDGSRLYLHGAAANRMLKTVSTGADVSIAVTLVDGLVFARSAFHHSMNYRSVVLFGRAEPVLNPSEKIRALRCVSDHIASGRWDEARPPTEHELKATSVVAFPIEEASAKIRTGGPIDDDDDYALPVWAGVLPVSVTPGAPIADEKLSQPVPVPPSVRNWRRAKA